MEIRNNGDGTKTLILAENEDIPDQYVDEGFYNFIKKDLQRQLDDIGKQMDEDGKNGKRQGGKVYESTPGVYQDNEQRRSEINEDIKKLRKK
jgi:hypothetical protein